MLKALDFAKFNADRRFALMKEVINGIHYDEEHNWVINDYDGMILFDKGEDFISYALDFNLDFNEEPWAVPIEDLGFSVRTYNVLKRSGIESLADILMHDGQFYKRGVRNMGRRSLEELKTCLMVRGLRLPPLRIHRYDIAAALKMSEWDDDIII